MSAKIGEKRIGNSMGRCAPQRFPRFTSECIQALRARVQTAGVDPDTAAGGKTSGSASRAGFTIEWNYDSADQVLTVQCVAAPVYVPCSLITAQIARWISSCYPAAPADKTSSESG